MVKNVKCGEVLADAGETSEFIFFVKSGSLVVQCVVDHLGQPLPLKELMPDLLAPEIEAPEIDPKFGVFYKWRENDMKKPPRNMQAARTLSLTPTLSL